jgi:hypothetical protein
MEQSVEVRGFVWFWGLIGLMILTAVAPVVLFESELPGVIASHWGVDGRPDDSLPVWGVVLATIGLIGLGAAIALLVRRPEGPSAESAGIATFFGALASGLAWSTALANRGASSWLEASSVGWLEALSVVGAALALAAAAFVVWGRIDRRGGSALPERGDALPVLAVGPGEQVAWTGSALVRWPLIVVFVGVVAFVLAPAWTRWLMLIGPVVSMFFLRVQATVSQSGLDVWLGPLRIRRIGFDRIIEADVIDVDPRVWGGWGWRVIPDASAIVLRRGEGILVRHPGGRRFVVTVDVSATGAGLINGLIARSH